jgi:hypothetical protein
MNSPWENHEEYQAGLAWGGRQVEAAEWERSDCSSPDMRWSHSQGVGGASLPPG